MVSKRKWRVFKNRWTNKGVLRTDSPLREKEKDVSRSDTKHRVEAFWIRVQGKLVKLNMKHRDADRNSSSRAGMAGLEMTLKKLREEMSETFWSHVSVKELTLRLSL